MTASNVTQLSLVTPTDPILNRIANAVKPTEVVSAQIQDTIDGMLRLAAGKGHSKEDSRQMVGLAAPQVGVNKRIIAIDITADGSKKEQHLQVFINPKITHHSKQTVPGREGCWSCGNVCGNVERAQSVTLEGLDRTGQPIASELTDFEARIAQHEIDHLDGIRFPDRIPVDQPDRLHWVEPTAFEDYRKNWQHWPVKCPRERWEALKADSLQSCDVCQFLENKPLKNQILTTKYWTVGIIADQPYLGRALITLLDHKSSLGKLTPEEWQEFETIVPKLEHAYKQAFGAEPLNMGCYMNHGYRDDPPHPHVHWQIFPRYKNPVELQGLTFKDSRYGNFFDDNARRPVGQEVIAAIVERLRVYL